MKNFIKKVKEYFKPYYISIVQEMICNTDFIKKHGNQWIGGRIEVYLNGPYSEFEIRFFTNKEKFYSDVYDHDFKSYSKRGIDKLKKLVKENYCHPPKNKIQNEKRKTN